MEGTLIDFLYEISCITLWKWITFYFSSNHENLLTNNAVLKKRPGLANIISKYCDTFYSFIAKHTYTW